MKLTSGISKRYYKAFILEEDSLRRIHGLLEKAAKELPDPSTVVFHVEREDDRYYQTTNIDDVTADPNIMGKRTMLTSIELRSTHQTQAQLSPGEPEWIVMVVFSLEERSGSMFSRGDRVIMRISSENKNWALLLSDELEPQIQRTFKVKQTPRWLLWLFALPFIVMAIKLSYLSLPLLQTTTEASLLMGFIGIVSGISAGVITGSVFALIYLRIGGMHKRFVRVFGPESAFLWGEEIESYQDREKLRQNILWGIIVAFVISLASSVIFALLFAPLQPK